MFSSFLSKEKYNGYLPLKLFLMAIHDVRINSIVLISDSPNNYKGDSGISIDLRQ